MLGVLIQLVFLRSDNNAKPLGPNVWCDIRVFRAFRATDSPQLYLVMFTLASNTPYVSKLKAKMSFSIQTYKL